SHSKTVVRGGIGLYYENSNFNNNLFNRPRRLQQVLFLNLVAACSNGNAAPFTLPGTSTVVTPAFCGQPIGTVASQIINLQKQLQAATIAAGPASNGAFIGNSLSAFGGVVLFAPNYQTPRSVQMNIGVQHQLWNGVVFSADYVRNVQTHSLLAVAHH